MVETVGRFWVAAATRSMWAALTSRRSLQYTGGSRSSRKYARTSRSRWRVSGERVTRAARVRMWPDVDDDLAAGRLVAPFGLSVRAVKCNALRTAAIGIPVNGRLVVIYTMAAGYAGVAGGLLAQTTQFVSLDVIAFHRSADVMLTLVLGGVGYLYGGLIGALVFKWAQSWLSDLTPEYWQFWIGLVFVALVVIGRERVFGWPAALLRRIAR